MTYDEIKFGKPQRKRTGKYFACENCQAEFYLPPSMQDGRGRFCSRKCQKEYHAVEKVCPACGKSFSVPQSIADRYTVCSFECRDQRKEYACERCGKSFMSHEQRWTPRFCSEECRRPPVYMNCDTCGKQFRKCPGNETRRFCSFSCYRRSNGETNLEKIIRNALEEMNVDFIQETQMGRYSIDFYFPGYWVALEVDGDYWHQDKKRDARKDGYLKKRGIKVIRIGESDIHSHGASEILSQKLSKFVSAIPRVP